MTSQLIALGCNIDRLTQLGSAVAMAHVCGAFTACHGHDCVTSRAACVPGCSEADFGDLHSSPKIFSRLPDHIFEMRIWVENYLPQEINSPRASPELCTRM